MTLPTRDQARGILMLRDVQVYNNEDGMAVVRAFVGGELMTADEWRLTFGLIDQVRSVMGQNDDGTPNGEDYIERRYVTEWEVSPV